MSAAKKDENSIEELLSSALSVSEACKISGFSEGWIRRLLIEGRLKGFKFGRAWMIPEQALREYMEQDHRPGPKTD